MNQRITYIDFDGKPSTKQFGGKRAAAAAWDTVAKPGAGVCFAIWHDGEQIAATYVSHSLNLGADVAPRVR